MFVPPDCETKLSLSNKAIALDLIYLRMFTKKFSWSLFNLLTPYIDFISDFLIIAILYKGSCKYRSLFCLLFKFFLLLIF